MRICLTRPNVPVVPTERHLLKHWSRVADSQASSITVTQAHENQSHEQLLTQLWLRAVRRGGKCLFSDVDFIPFPGAIELVRTRLDYFKAVFVPYFTRDDEKNCLRKHPFWTGLWFWAVRLDHGDLLPRPDWIKTIGRPLDVGCGGLFHFLQSGFCGPNDVLFFDGEECMDAGKRWAHYPDLGYHLFYHRKFHEPDFQVGPNYTVREHLQEIDACLNRLGTPE